MSTELFNLVVHDRFNLDDDEFHRTLRTAAQKSAEPQGEYLNLLFSSISSDWMKKHGPS